MGEETYTGGVYDSVKRRLDTLEAIEQAQQMIASEPDPDAILDILASSAARIIGAETLSVTLLSEDKKTVCYAYAKGKHADTFNGLVLDISSAGLCGWVLANRKPILSVNLLEDPRVVRESAVSLGIHTAVLAPLVAKGEIVGGLSAFNKKDGSKFSEEDLAALSHLAGYAALAVVNSRLMSNILRENMKVETILDGVVDGILFVTCDGIISEANSAARELSGTGLDRLAGVNIKEVDGSDPIHEVLGWDAQAVPGERCWERLSCGDSSCPAYGVQTLRCWAVSSGHCTTSTGRGAGEDKLWEHCSECESMKSASARLGEPRVVEVAGRTLRVSSTMVMKSGTDCISGELVVIHDITAEKELDMQKNEFVSMLSHDLKSPLTSIKGYSEILGLEDDLDEIREINTAIASNTEQLLRLINQMLEYFHVETGRLSVEKTQISPNAFFGMVMERYRRTAAEKGFALDWKVAHGTCDLIADIDLLSRMVANLVTNAIEHVKPGGNISVSAENGPQGYVTIRVTDDGQGIGAEHLPRIFEKYYSKGRRSAGTSGLGLYIVKALCELQGGSVGVESDKGIGTTFRMVLPADPCIKEA